MYLTRNQAWVQIHRGFESHPVRHTAHELAPRRHHAFLKRRECRELLGLIALFRASGVANYELSDLMPDLVLESRPLDSQILNGITMQLYATTARSLGLRSCW